MDGELHAILEPESDHPLARVGRFTGLKAEGYVPIEIQAERSRRWTTRTLLAATLVLALLNARSLSSWASTLAPTWGSVTVRELADVWSGRMAAAGLDGPRAGMRSAWQGGKALTWRQVGGLHVEVVKPHKR
jgi:hypothetical protein